MGAENRSAAAGCTWGRGRWLHATRVQPYESRDYYSNSSSRQQQCGGGGGGDRGEQDQERLRLHNAQWLGLPAAAALVLIWRERADCEATQTHKKVEVLRLSTPHQVQKIAGLVNALVDMDYWTEEEEQYIFEHAVRLVLEAIETILPPPMLRLMIHSDDCDGLGEEQADTLRNRLVEYCKWKLQLPFLDNMDEVRVITAVCAVLVESLKKGNSFENVVEPVNSGELILDVFVKGAVGLLDQAHQKEFIATIAGGMEIPFVPEWILKWVVSKFITEVAMAFEDSLLYTYSIRISKSYDLAAERVGAARTTKSFCEMRDRKPHHPFALLHKVTAAEFVGKAPLFESGRLWANGQLLLPSDESVNYGEEVRNKLVKDLNDRINVIGWVCDKFEQWEGIIISKIVDITLLESMDMEKMEVYICVCVYIVCLWLCRYTLYKRMYTAWTWGCSPPPLPPPPPTHTLQTHRAHTQGCISFLCRENFAYALGYEWFECIKEEGLAYPPGWSQNEWYWQVAKELDTMYDDVTLCMMM